MLAKRRVTLWPRRLKSQSWAAVSQTGRRLNSVSQLRQKPRISQSWASYSPYERNLSRTIGKR